MFTVCGLDEVGRGALAGPLMAVASLFYFGDRNRYCIPAPPQVPKPTTPYNTSGMPVGYVSPSWLLEHSPIKGVNDSKKLTAKRRREAFTQILRSEKLIDFGIGQVSVEEINQRGIDWANQEAFKRAVQDLSYLPSFVIVDGDNPLMGWNIVDQKVEPRADGKWWPVAAASVLAKVIRDSYMKELAGDWPLYGWEKNSGYGSEQHRIALLEWGATPEHRTQFIRRIIGEARAD